MADLDRPSLQQIYTRMLADMQARVTSNTRIPVASLLNILVIVFSGAIYLVYGYLSNILNQLFVATQNLFFLIRFSSQFGVNRKAASFAQGQVIFTGVATTLISAGEALEGSTGLSYVTTEDFTIGTTVSAGIIATEAGTESNSTDSFISVVNPIVNVDDSVAVVNSEISGGAAEETKEELKLRTLQRLQNPPASGSKTDYIRWALTIPGIDRVFIRNGAEYLGGGSVAVICATEQLQPVGATALAAAGAYIDTQKPVGARFVDEIDVVPVSTIYTIDLLPNTSANQDAITASLERMHLLESIPGGTINLNQVRAAISETPLTNYEITDMTIDGAPGVARDIVTTGFDIARFTSATYGDL